MVVIKGEVLATTIVSNGRISRTVLHLDDDDESLKSLRLYIKPLINDFVNRRVLPGLSSEGSLSVKTRVKIRESKGTQTVTIEHTRI